MTHSSKQVFFLRSLLLIILIHCFSFISKSQLCNGSLGDPAVNITFGSGGNNPGYTPPGYIYTSSSCPDDGFYTITSSTSNCFGNSWHTVTADHTGNGSFMLVNASYDPGDFFVTTVTDLCPNTTYEFAAWIMNVLNRSGIMPDLTFSIEAPGGIILQQFNTGEIYTAAQPAWQQYGFYFTTPLNNPTIVLRITNKAPGGLGNDLALDDITFRPCGPLIEATIQGSAGNIVDVCEGNTNEYVFTSTVSSAYISPVYQWQISTDSGTTWKDIAGANSISYLRQPTSAGSYWYRLAVVEASAAGINSCRIGSNGVIVNVHGKPIVDAGRDRIMLTGSNIQLDGNATGEDITYSWSPDDHIDDISSLKPVVAPAGDIVYTLSAISAFGCKAEDKASVRVVTGIYVPSAFTPNNDGKNDRWEIPFLDPSFGASVSVFNRYGQLVYHTKGEIVSWDGRLNGIPQATGNYVYMVILKAANLQLKGNFVLIR